MPFTHPGGTPDVPDRRRDANARESDASRDRVATTSGAPRPAQRSTAPAAGLGVAAGLWLIVAPYVLDYGDGDPAWNDVLSGVAIALLALVRLADGHRGNWPSWTIAAIGSWVFVSALCFDDTMTAAVDDTIVGALVAVIGVASATPTHDGSRGDTCAPPR